MTQSGDNAAKADVYAADTTIPVASSGSQPIVFLFAIEADAEPGVLARVSNLFNLANLAPLRVNFHRISSEHANIVVEIELSNSTIADMIRRKLAQLTCTISVELTVSNAGKSS